MAAKKADTVTLTAPRGTRVTVSAELAEKLLKQGYKKPRGSKSDTDK